MPGKQAGLSAACWPDRLIADLPNYNLYASNNPSEGMIAKRRAGATLISYLTPPVAHAGLYRGLLDLKASLDRFRALDPDTDAEQRDALGDAGAGAGGNGRIGRGRARLGRTPHGRDRPPWRGIDRAGIHADPERPPRHRPAAGCGRAGGDVGAGGRHRPGRTRPARRADGAVDHELPAIIHALDGRIRAALPPAATCCERPRCCPPAATCTASTRSACPACSQCRTAHGRPTGCSRVMRLDGGEPAGDDRDGAVGHRQPQDPRAGRSRRRCG